MHRKLYIARPVLLMRSMTNESDSLHDIRTTVQSATVRIRAAATAGNAPAGMHIANNVLPQIQSLSPLDSVRQGFAQALQRLVDMEKTVQERTAQSTSAPTQKQPSTIHTANQRTPKKTRTRVPLARSADIPEDAMAAKVLFGLLEVKLARMCHGAPVKNRRRIRESAMASLSKYSDVRCACERIASVLQQPQCPDRPRAIRTIINSISLRDNPELSTLITETLDQMLVDRGILPAPPDDDAL
ncbi:hypothetical protein GX553_00490 [Candidatus Peribacteria bacterium]|nr:hypothetical protein [Candidatus Peribacteria bacterium]